MKRNAPAKASLPRVPHSVWKEEDPITIPKKAHKQPIMAYPVSTRLKHIFQRNHFTHFGDLNGRAYKDFRRYRGFGTKSISELRSLAKAVQLGTHPSKFSQLHKSPAHQPKADLFFVPESVRHFSPYNYLLSARLEPALRRLGVKRLGDLHGLSQSVLLNQRNCGARSVTQLLDLMDDLDQGNLSEPSSLFADPGMKGMIVGMNSIIDQLPKRECHILLLRCGIESDRQRTLEEVGRKFQLTRERVRQVCDNTLLMIHKVGGPPLERRLSAINELCHKKVFPLTPEYLLQELGPARDLLRYPAEVYVRLFRELVPSIPVWPQGQELCYFPNKALRLAEREIQSVIEAKGEPISFKNLFSIFASRKRGKPLQITDFLSTLRRSAKLQVSFATPDCPRADLRAVQPIDHRKKAK